MRVIVLITSIHFLLSGFAFASEVTIAEARKFAQEYEQEIKERGRFTLYKKERKKEKPQTIAFDAVYSRTIERKLKAPAGETDKIKPMQKSHLKISYIRNKELQPYVALGSTELKEKMGNLNIAGLGRRNIDFEYYRAFGYGGGINGRFDFAEGWFVGYDWQYLKSEHKLKKVIHSGQTASSKTGKVRVQEWYTAFSLGKEFSLGTISKIPLKISPYIGGRYSDLELKIIRDIQYTVSEGTIGVEGSTKAKNKWGAFSGLNLSLGDNWSLGMEGRFADETAFSGSVGLKF